jgi:hypothetical protein
MAIDKFIVAEVQRSKWLDINSTAFMNIKKSTRVHEVFERIWLNVAISYSARWQELYYAKPTDMRLYVGRVVGLLLINTILKTHLDMDEDEITSLLGRKNMDIIDEYYRFLDR